MVNKPDRLLRAAAIAGAAALAPQAPGCAAGGPLQLPPPAGVVRSDLIPLRQDWVKVCFNDPQSRKEVCYTTRDFAEEGETPIVALEVFDSKDEDQKLVRLLLPLGIALKPGFRLAVDKGKPESGVFEVCFPAGCYASAKVGAALVEGMKKGEKLAVTVKKLSGEEMAFFLPLAGFGKAFDGPGAEPKALEEQQQKLQQQLQKKAEEERQRLEAQTRSLAPEQPK
jgi:invasion protein IalB